MGSPISGTIAEVFLQHLEHIHIRPLLQDKRILLYTRYVDDILIIYDTETTSHDFLTQHTNTMHSNLQFTPKLESSGHINFLDLTIVRRNTHRNRHIQKTYYYRHHNTFHIHPPQ